MAHMDVIGLSGIQFYGKMSASISHDLKNVLAVINENAGLLEDLCLMAGKGKPLDPGRLKRLAEEVKHQVRRGDRITTSMNDFAHSVDEPLRQAELNDTLGLMCTLSGRFASMRGVTLELEPASAQISIVTNPFFLQNLLWLCLDFAMSVTGAIKKVVLKAEKIETGAKICFSKLQELGRKEPGPGSFPGEREAALLQALKARLEIQKESGELHLLFPAQAEI